MDNEITPMIRDYSNRPSLEEEISLYEVLETHYNDAVKPIPPHNTIKRLSKRKLRRVSQHLAGVKQTGEELDTLEKQIQEREKELSTAGKKAKIAWATFMAGFLGQCYDSFKYTGHPISTYLPPQETLQDSLSTLKTVGSYLQAAALSYGAYTIPAGTVKRTKALIQGTFLHDGLYALHRHPIYFAFRYAAIGIFLGNPTLEQAAYTTAAVLASEWVAQQEEHVLGIRYGKSYAEYKEKVNRWLPSLRTLKNVGLK